MSRRPAAVMILVAGVCLQVLACTSGKTAAAKTPAPRSGALLGKWDVVKGKKPPASLQYQFSADVYIKSLDLLDDGKLRVTRERGPRTSDGRWSYIPDGSDSGLLQLVYPRWGRSSATNDLWLCVDFENDNTMKILNLTDVPTILKKRTAKKNGPK